MYLHLGLLGRKTRPNLRKAHSKEFFESYLPAAIQWYIRTIFYYLFSTNDIIDKAALAETLHNHLPPEVEETVMTFADQLRAEGRQEGWQEAMQTLAIKLLQEKTPQEVATLTGLSPEAVKALTSKKSTQHVH